MNTDDIFGDMDKQISAINDAVRNNRETVEWVGVDESFNETISKVELKEMTARLGETADAIQTIKIARKQDFGAVRSDERKLLDWGDQHRELGGTAHMAQPSYAFSYEELPTLNVFGLISRHDSYWAIDFVKATIDTVVEENTGFKIVNGKCERYILSGRQLKRKIGMILHLDEDDAFGDQMIKLFSEVIDWKTEMEGKADVITVIDSEIDMKKELLEYDYDGLKDLFEWSDDDMITYHVLHFVVKEKALAIIAIVRQLLDRGYTPKSLGLNAEDNWAKEVYKRLGIKLEGEDIDWLYMTDEDIAYAGLEDRDDWNDDLDELESRLKSIEISEEQEMRVREGNSKGGSTKGKRNAAKSISIRVIETGETKVFDNRTDCMKYLGVGKEVFSRFIKGQSKLNKKYQISNGDN